MGAPLAPSERDSGWMLQRHLTRGRGSDSRKSPVCAPSQCSPSRATARSASVELGNAASSASETGFTGQRSRK
jgi:hypothetical protein